MTTTRKQTVKRETTASGGLLTPKASFEINNTSRYGDEDMPGSIASNPLQVPHQPPSINNTTQPANNKEQEQGLSVLGHDVNRLVNLIDKLRRIGLKSVDGALPELVLVGDQSVSNA